MNTQPIIDLNTFKELSESVGADFVKELLDTYFEETPQLISKLEDSFSKKDCDAFRIAAHSIKSTSNSFGALNLGSMAKELEMMGRESNLDGAKAKIEALVNHYVDVKKALAELTNG